MSKQKEVQSSARRLADEISKAMKRLNAYSKEYAFALTSQPRPYGAYDLTRHASGWCPWGPYLYDVDIPETRLITPALLARAASFSLTAPETESARQLSLMVSDPTPPPAFHELLDRFREAHQLALLYSQGLVPVEHTPAEFEADGIDRKILKLFVDDYVVGRKSPKFITTVADLVAEDRSSVVTPRMKRLAEHRILRCEGQRSGYVMTREGYARAKELLEASSTSPAQAQH